MAISVEASNALLGLYLNNVAAANVGDASGLQPSATAGNSQLALHTADPGTGSSQATNECAYTGYARKAVARSGTKWTVSGGQAVNAEEILFGENTGATTEIATHVSVGSASSGAGHKQLVGTLTAPLTVQPGVIPRFAAGTITVTFA